VCFLESNDVESAIRNAVSLGGDADTQACIAGAIAGAYYGCIPESFISKMNSLLPVDFINICEKFVKMNNSNVKYSK
jgi:ADP-ribosylglycohydrolase